MVPAQSEQLVAECKLSTGWRHVVGAGIESGKKD